jgi:hypothetical protein
LKNLLKTKYKLSGGKEREIERKIEEDRAR